MKSILKISIIAAILLLSGKTFAQSSHSSANCFATIVPADDKGKDKDKDKDKDKGKGHSAPVVVTITTDGNNKSMQPQIIKRDIISMSLFGNRRRGAARRNSSVVF